MRSRWGVVLVATAFAGLPAQAVADDACTSTSPDGTTTDDALLRLSANAIGQLTLDVAAGAGCGEASGVLTVRLPTGAGGYTQVKPKVTINL
jgi:hypothetical protein